MDLFLRVLPHKPSVLNHIRIDIHALKLDLPTLLPEPRSHAISSYTENPALERAPTGKTLEASVNLYEYLLGNIIHRRIVAEKPSDIESDVSMVQTHDLLKGGNNPTAYRFGT